MRLRVVALFAFGFSCVASRVTCQVAWSVLPSPQVQVLAYDSHRDVVVALAPTISTEEFDGTVWRSVTSTTMPDSNCIATYDSNRQRTVVVDLSAGLTWEWDGVAWQVVGTAPVGVTWPITTLQFVLLAYNELRQRVVLVRPGPSQSSGIDMYEWDGAAWTQVPAAGAPPSTPDPWGYYMYHSLAYDSRVGKLVLFGRSEILYVGALVGRSALTWEWDAANGWTQFPASGVIGNGTEMWFDKNRGVLLRYDGMSGPIPHHVNARSASGVWTPMPFTGTPFVHGGCYDSRRSRFYSGDGVIVGYFSDAHPAIYTAHGSPCPGPNPPALGLTAPWTRAWQGSVLSLDASSLPLSIAILATGFSDQIYGTVPLPLDLTGFGMPQCHLRVAPEATIFAAGSNGSATFQIPIPNVPGVVGVSFWQQVFAPAPGANPAGMRASNSMRGVVGRSQ